MKLSAAISFFVAIMVYEKRLNYTIALSAKCEFNFLSF